MITVRPSQVVRLARLIRDREGGEMLDGAASIHGIDTRWSEQANNLLDAARRNSTREEYRAAEHLAENHIYHEGSWRE
jgi:hypothetical protein